MVSKMLIFLMFKGGVIKSIFVHAKRVEYFVDILDRSGKNLNIYECIILDYFSRNEKRFIIN